MTTRKKESARDERAPSHTSASDSAATQATGSSAVSANGGDGEFTFHPSIPERVQKVVKFGWRVVPQMLFTKTPHVKWKRYQSVDPTPAEIKQWATDYPNCLWAIVTGQASGVIVLDFDVEYGGMETLKKLELKPTMLTPSGGAHVYVHAPDYEVCGFARLDPENLPGMDLRADGQLATFFGENFLTGGSYELAEGWEIYHHEDLPLILRRMLVDRRKAAQAPAVELPDGFDDFTDHAVLVQEALEIVESGGSRNGAGFHLACQLRDERYTFDDAEPLQMAFADTVADGGHPYTRQEAYNSLVSAYSSPPREPRAMGKFKFSDGFPKTDLGNAERLINLFGEDLRHATVIKKWYIWDGRRWAIDNTAEIERRAKNTVRNILRSAADIEDSNSRSALISFARRSENATRIHAMIHLGASELGVPVTADELDTESLLFNVANGTLDLRTGKIHEHQRSDLITRISSIKYEKTATAPRWQRFLKRVLPDPELRSFIQRAVGYSLTGETSEHVAFLLYGIGANGKSTFLETIRLVLGDYSQQAPSELLLAKRTSSVPNDVARLHGARFVTASETDEGRQLAEALFKQLTGGDRIASRFMRSEFFEFTPVAKFWLATNHKPEVKGTGEAIWRRILLLPFTVTIPEAERDQRLLRNLRTELPGILQWAVEGAREWQSVGLGVPKIVRAATDAYRDEMDVLADFLDECCVIGDAESVPASRIYEKYDMWAQLQGVRFPMTQRSFGMKLSERGFVRNRVGANKIHTWFGLTLVDTPKMRLVRDDK